MTPRRAWHATRHSWTLTLGRIVQKKRRLDDVCRDLVPEYSMNVIRSFILSGKVFVDEQKVTKAGHQVRVSY